VTETPRIVIITTLIWIAAWVAALLVVIALPRLTRRRIAFVEELKAQWKPSLGIAGVYLGSTLLGGRGILNPYVLAVFCQAMFGLTIASGIPGCQALRMSQALIHKRQIWRDLFGSLLVTLLVVVPAILVGTIGLSIGKSIFGEVNQTAQAQAPFTGNPAATFFLFLAGSGIAEETPYRLFLVTALWRLTRRPGLAIVASALIFGLYHLTPLDGQYQTFWLFPISQVLASSLIGVIWGYLYRWRGYEAAVLAHTLSNWLPILIFAR
jgi:membrane protease YdiL (CAAX protease family)